MNLYMLFSRRAPSKVSYCDKVAVKSATRYFQVVRKHVLTSQVCQQLVELVNVSLLAQKSTERNFNELVTLGKTAWIE